MATGSLTAAARAQLRVDGDKPRQGFRELQAARECAAAAVRSIGDMQRHLAAGHMLSVAAGTTAITRAAHAALEDALRALLTVDEHLGDAYESEMEPLRQAEPHA